MPNILFDCERMKYPNTGLFTFCDNLGKALLDQAGSHENLFFYMPRKMGEHFGKKGGYIWQNSLHKFYLPHRQRIDVWHTTYQSSPYRSPKKAMRRILTIHDLNFLHEDKSAREIKKYLGIVQRTINDADKLVAISNYAKQEVLQYLNIAKKPLEVIYNGSTVHEYPGFDAPRYRPAAPFLFSMGTVLPKKNFHVLPCLTKGTDMQLIIAGNINEPYKARIEEEAKKHGVAAQVKIIGPVSDQEKYWYLKNCEAFLFPSLAEGFGLPVLEAMHFGKPVFLSDRTSLPEIGGEAAYYFHDFDPEYMRSVLRDGLSNFHQLQRAEIARRHAAKFNWDDAAKTYLKMYSELY